MKIERHGDGWYTDDAEYVVRPTAGGHAVCRGDGSYAEFLDADEAMEAAELLARGEAQDSDYDWHD